MREIKTKVYSFRELNDEAKTKAIKNRRYKGEYDLDTDYIVEDLEESYGFTDVKVYWSGFYSQGDGACFTGRLDNNGIAKLIEKENKVFQFTAFYNALKLNTIYCTIKIEHSGRYYHEYMTNTTCYFENQDNSELTGDIAKDAEKFQDWFDDRINDKTDRSKNCGDGWLIRKNKAIYKMLESDDEYKNSDEYISEQLIESGEEFTEDGIEFNG